MALQNRWRPRVWRSAAGEFTIWEGCCLGLPSLVVGIAENQRGLRGAGL